MQPRARNLGLQLGHWCRTLRIAHREVEHPDQGLDPITTIWWNRFRILFMVVGILAVVASLLDADAAPFARAAGVIVFGVLAIVCWRYWTSRFMTTRQIVGVLAVTIPLFFVLVSIHPAFYLLVAAVYWHVFATIRVWPASLISVAFTVVLLASFGDGVFRVPFESIADWGIFGISVAVGCGMAGFIHSLFQEMDKRRILIAELESTRARLSREERQSGMLIERQRIAAEIHDTIAQDLTSVVMHIRAAERRLTGENHPATMHLNEALNAARSGLDEARQIVHALLPDILSDRTVEDAIEELAHRWQETTSIPATFTTVGTIPHMPRGTEVVIIRTVQETLANIRKHSQATTVNITLTTLDDQIVVDVHDNGIGVAASSAGRGTGDDAGGLGLGLQTMYERARSVGGEMVVESAADSGTTVSIAIPLESTADGTRAFKEEVGT